ncbi:MAG: hypothetical protein QNJ84_18950 [Alphaproteobacteria bacterium]|nr:hypothetical protein [Alphaproteobacteria bacterium]
MTDTEKPMPDPLRGGSSQGPPDPAPPKTAVADPVETPAPKIEAGVFHEPGEANTAQADRAIVDPAPEPDAEAAQPTLRPPGSDAGEEAWTAFYQALGAPKSVTGYSTPKGMDSEAARLAKQAAHKAGLSNRQFDAMMAANEEALAALRQEGEARHREEYDAMKTRYGARFEGVRRDAERGRGVFDPSTQALIDTLGLFQHAGFVEGLARLGGARMEDSAHAGRTGSLHGNPYDQANPNLTEQARLERDEPETARHLAAAAGVKPTL